MTPEERSLLERSCTLAEENNAMLRSMRRNSRISTTIRIIYWVVILGVSAGAYYLIQPYVQSVLGAYSQITGGNNTNKNETKMSPSYFESLQDLLK